MAVDQLSMLIGLAIFLGFYLLARMQGWIQPAALKADQYDNMVEARNFLISFTYGARLIYGGDMSGPKPKVYLSGMGNVPVYDIILGENTFEIDKFRGFFGLPTVYLHINLNDTPEYIKSLFNVNLRDRLAEMQIEVLHLREENEKLRSNVEGYMKQQSTIIGDIKRKTTPIVLQGGKRKTSDEAELDR